MKTIKKITAKTIFFMTAIVGVSFVSSLLGRLFFGSSGIDLTKMGSVTDKNTAVSSSLFSVAQADTPAASGGDSGSDCDGGSGDGDGG